MKRSETLDPKDDEEESIVDIIQYIILTISSSCNLTSLSSTRFIREKGVPIESHPSNIFGSMGLAYPQSRGMKHSRELQYVLKNEIILCVDNISLCDESKSRKITENKLHQTSKSRDEWK